MATCPVCKTQIHDGNIMNPGRDAKYVRCARCGEFELSERAEAVMALKGDLPRHRRAITSHAIRRMQRPGTVPRISSNMLDAIWKEERLPSPQQQADYFILMVGEAQPAHDAYAVIGGDVVGSTIGAALSPDTGNTSGWSWVLRNLQGEGLVEHDPNHNNSGQPGFRLTFKGWERFEELHRKTAESRVAFMAMKFNDAALDQAYRDCFKPAVARTNFELRRLDENQPAGLIDNHMRVAIRAARFLIADLTHGNHGAYWEAGFAEGLGKPVIYTCEKGYFTHVRTHFDTNHSLTIRWSADSLEAAANELADTIRNTLPTEAKLTDD